MLRYGAKIGVNRKLHKILSKLLYFILMTNCPSQTLTKYLRTIFQTFFQIQGRLGFNEFTYSVGGLN